MLKSRSLVVFLYNYSLAHRHAWRPIRMRLFLFAFLFRFDKKLFYRFYYCNFSMYVMTTAIGLQSTLKHSTGCLIVCFPGMTLLLAKVNKSSGVHFQTPFFTKLSYFLTFLNIQIDSIILKTYDEQFTLTTKKSLHITFKSVFADLGLKVEDLDSEGEDLDLNFEDLVLTCITEFFRNLKMVTVICIYIKP